VRGFRDAQEGETAALVAAGPAGRERRLVAEKRRGRGWGRQRRRYRRKIRPTRRPAATEDLRLVEIRATSAVRGPADFAAASRPGQPPKGIRQARLPAVTSEEVRVWGAPPRL
jgi:hypothetical protein